MFKGNDPTTPSYNVLQDVLAILSSKAIQIPHGATGAAATAAGAASAMGEELSAEVALGAVKDKLLSKISHKNIMQNTIPVLIALRARMQESRSPLLKNLNSYMTFIFRTHRSDLMKALAEDPQLAAEIKYDLAQFDEEQKRKRRQSQKRRRRRSGGGGSDGGGGGQWTQPGDRFRPNLTNLPFVAPDIMTSLDALADAAAAAAGDDDEGGGGGLSLIHI